MKASLQEIAIVTELFRLVKEVNRTCSQPYMARMGLSQLEADVLMVLSGHQKKGETIRPGSLARLLRMPASSLSQALKPLEDKGYVKRERLRDDARTVSIELTERGWELAEGCQYEMHALITEFCNTIGVDEIEDLMASLDKVLEFANSYGRPTRV
ncbi:hypothetical protein C1879_05160 [Paraeggerthella hongkongensis]|jgi:DNA-binding MarR family transcriptional regulator|nr:hypothetical protein C1879_05160 [Paraeggerthella hongkongensis]